MVICILNYTEDVIMGVEMGIKICKNCGQKYFNVSRSVRCEKCRHEHWKINPLIKKC